MTPQEAIDELKRINEEHGDDLEMAHIKGDELLCKFLTELGYSAVVDEYEKLL